ncbi:MAG: hypothetical protein AAF715_30125, partial [Myxococcota bacterium]
RPPTRKRVPWGGRAGRAPVARRVAARCSPPRIDKAGGGLRQDDRAADAFLARACRADAGYCP